MEHSIKIGDLGGPPLFFGNMYCLVNTPTFTVEVNHHIKNGGKPFG